MKNTTRRIRRYYLKNPRKEGQKGGREQEGRYEIKEGSETMLTYGMKVVHKHIKVNIVLCGPKENTGWT